MRLIEVVMLVGAHCVSPVEHTEMTTDATKVQCAVVMEKDTERGTLTVTPREAASNPLVAAAVERFRLAPTDGPGGTRIVPAWAAAGSPATEIKRPAQPPASVAATVTAAPPPPVSEAPTTASDAQEAEQKLATLSPPPPKVSPAKPATAPRVKKPAKAQAAAAAKPGSQCKGSAVAKWYKTADGRKKYRCVKPASDNAPDQLY